MKSLFVSFVLLFQLLSIATYSQYIPPEKSIKFRIYGENAKPISDSDNSYKVIIPPQTLRDYTDTLTNGLLKLTGRFWGQEKLKLTITHNQIPMIISFPLGALDSAIYSPGYYNILFDYAPLFEARALNGCKIINQVLDSFKVNDSVFIEKAGQNKNIHILSNDHINAYSMLPKTRTIVLIAQKTDGSRYLMFRNANDEKCGKFDLHIATYQSWLTIPINGNTFYFIGSGGSYSKMNDKGALLYNDEFLTKALGNYYNNCSLYFIDKDVGYAMEGYPTADTVTVYKTIDGGNKWSKISIPKFKGGYSHICKFIDENNGYIYSYKYDYPTVISSSSLLFYTTSDGCKTLTEYIPREKQFDAINDEYLPQLNYNSAYKEQYYFYVYNKKDSQIYRIHSNLNLSKVEVNGFPPLIAGLNSETWAIIFNGFLFITRDSAQTWKYASLWPIVGPVGAEFRNANTLVLYSYSGIYEVALN